MSVKKITPKETAMKDIREAGKKYYHAYDKYIRGNGEKTIVFGHHLSV